jgi:hypothetical protein
MADIRSAEGWREYIDRFAKRFARRAEEEEQELAMATLFMNRHPITGTPFKEDSALSVIARFDERESCKSDYMKVVRAASVAGDAFASCFMSEAWMSVAPRASSTEEALKQVRVPPSEDPQRKEILLLMCEHRTFESCTLTSIIDTVDGKRRCGRWRRAPLFEGDFAHVVAPKPADGPTTALIRTYLKLLQDRGQISEFIPMDLDDAVN